MVPSTTLFQNHKNISQLNKTAQKAKYEQITLISISRRCTDGQQTHEEMFCITGKKKNNKKPQCDASHHKEEYI